MLELLSSLNLADLALPALALVEWFLGNTKLVEANSTISLILNGLASALRFLSGKKE